MEKFFQFVVNHWVTWLALAVVLGLLIYEEMRGKMSGVQRLSPQELTQLINRDEVVVIDLRDTVAFEQGHIVGSISMPTANLMDNIEQLDKYKNKGVVLIDGAGQGIRIAHKLRQRGFKLYTLAGGIDTWKSLGLPLTKK